MIPSPLKPTVLSIPVTLDGIQGASIAARCYAPVDPSGTRLPHPVWVFAIHGSGADWRYWDIWVPGREEQGYSFAEFITRRGVGLVSIDVLGVGESRFPADGALLTLDLLGSAHAQAAAECRKRLAEGRLIPGLQPIPDVRWCGIGHSGGAGCTMVVQGDYASFDLIGLHGMPADDFEVLGGHDGVRGALSLDASGMLGGGHDAQVDSVAALRSRARAHMDDVPDVVINARDARTFPPSFPSMMRRGVLLPYARRIVCPVFTAFGEIDYGGSPFEEPRRFAGSSDVTVHIQPGSAHQHNTATTRGEIWLALYNWIYGRLHFGEGRRPNTAPRAATRVLMEQAGV